MLVNRKAVDDLRLQELMKPYSRFFKFQEKTGVSYDFHCVMWNAEMSEKDYFFGHLQDSIPDEALYSEIIEEKPKYLAGSKEPFFVEKIDKYGKEKNPHVTVLYGLKNEADYFELRRKLANVKSFEIKLGSFSYFDTNPDYDVCVIQVESPELIKLNKMIRDSFDYENNFPDYKPHMTLAYVKKDVRFKMKAPVGKTFHCTKLQWSHVDGYELELPL